MGGGGLPPVRQAGGGLVCGLYAAPEMGGPFLQSFDLAKDDGGRVRVDLVSRRFLADVAAAQEVRADKRANRVPVTSGLAGTPGNPQKYVLLGENVAAKLAEHRAVLAGAAL